MQINDLRKVKPMDFYILWKEKQFRCLKIHKMLYCSDFSKIKTFAFIKEI